MKRVSFYLAGLMAMIAVSCVAPEEWGDKTETRAVPQLTGASTEAIPGGAIISYTLPDFVDLAYVRVLYTLSDGTAADRKTSIHSAPQIVVEGFGRAEKQTVQLICVDESGNESAPYMLEIETLDSPIYEIAKTIEMKTAIDGVRVTWKNPSEANMVLNLYMLNESVNRFLEVYNVSSSLPAGRTNFLGVKKESTFAASVSDKWGNRTGLTGGGTFVPIRLEDIEGSLLDITKYAKWNPEGIPYNAYTNYDIENMWDGVTGSGLFWFLPSFAMPFTFDLGQDAILTKFKIWQCHSQYYGYYNIKRFRLYGSDTPDVNENESTWKFMGEYALTKPSGLDGTEVTADDRAFAAAGEEIDIKPEHRFLTRYIRFDPLETWDGRKAYVSINELHFYGVLLDD